MYPDNFKINNLNSTKKTFDRGSMHVRASARNINHRANNYNPTTAYLKADRPYDLRLEKH